MYKKRRMSGLPALAMTLGLLATVPGQAKAAEATEVPIQTKQDWSGANRFNAWDSSVSKPKAGCIGNYYLFGHGDGSLSALIVAKDVVHLERYDRLGSVSANGGTFSDGSTTVEITYDYCYFTEPPDFPTLERYVFDGWAWNFTRLENEVSWNSPILGNPVPNGVNERKAIWIGKKNGDIIYDASKLAPFDFHAESGLRLSRTAEITSSPTVFPPIW